MRSRTNDRMPGFKVKGIVENQLVRFYCFVGFITIPRLKDSRINDQMEQLIKRNHITLIEWVADQNWNSTESIDHQKSHKAIE